ncbi:L-threonylcarbamoyladenylate synthase [Leucobacter luti]|uniref:L-threonylcarbamoyladenylate synthase n=1 Tax=Leucobacter luti TaxID=340320 RepID=UPI003CFFA3FD
MTRVVWDGSVEDRAVERLERGGGIVVCPTKVGYIILASDREGLERKFAAKGRARTKPGVVLCGSLEQLAELAELTPEIAKFYRRHWEQDILLGCILPWSERGRGHLPDDGTSELVMDARGTSCFIVRFGTPGEQIARARWEHGRGLTFASSANPSGQGNRGLVAGIGPRIAAAADLIIESDEYVSSIQPDATLESRYEQGVMVSFVDAHGRLVPEQGAARSVTPAPTVIRKGLDIDRIMMNLADCFGSWDYRHGEYY